MISGVVIVCGEALIDLVPSGGDGFTAHPGGGPFNTAVALGRLGVPVGFLGRLSTDGFGRRLRAQLGESGVDLGWVASGDEPTALAVVGTDEHGDPAFTFYIEGTAERLLRPADVPLAFGAEVDAVCFGTLALVLEPAASTLEGVMRREHGRRLVVLDPNVRPAVLPDRDDYRARVERWVALADVVKVSLADLRWLYPRHAPEAVAERWFGAGPALVVVTRGGDGVLARAAPGTIEVAAAPAVVVDTVGAGDSFSAGLLAALHERGALARGALDAMAAPDLTAVLRFASVVAAETCSRAGADPPWRHELPSG